MTWFHRETAVVLHGGDGLLRCVAVFAGQERLREGRYMVVARSALSALPASQSVSGRGTESSSSRCIDMT